MAENTCLYPGSFDPVTLGHMDVITRLSGMYEKVYVGILVNPDKCGLFTAEERKTMLEEACGKLKNVEVVVWNGLAVELLKKLGIRVIARGVRGAGEFESEAAMSQLNHALWPEAETVFLAASPEKTNISSSAVRQIMSFGGDISAFVPVFVKKAMERKFGAI